MVVTTAPARALLLSLLVLLLLLPQHGNGASALAESGTEQQVVIVLHGLARLPGSMGKMAKRLEREGYTVCNIGYPSRKYTISDLVDNFVASAVRTCADAAGTGSALHFVTHSMGGIVVRQLAHAHPDIPIGRVVMLSPPNKGSELVNELGDWYLYKLFNGPAGLQLGTEADSVPNSLGSVTFELGVIAGNVSTNPFYSRLIPGADDGKVAVTRARQDGMQDFLVLPYAHTFIARKNKVIRQTLHFLNNGEFKRP